MAPRSKDKGLIELQEKLDLARKHRRPYERDWFLNLAYVEGEQHVNWAFDPSNRIVEKQFDDNDVVQPIHNIFVKISRIERAKILKNKPVPTAVPTTDSDDDYYAAKIIDAYFRHLQDRWNYEVRLRHATPWLVNTGNVFFKWFWADGNQMAVVSPFDVYWDPYSRTFPDSRWVIHQQFMSEETAQELYDGIKGAHLEAIRSTNTDTLSPLESRIFSMYGMETGQNLPGVTVNEYWEPPSKHNPKGRFCVFSEHGVILDHKFPYAHGKMPFTHAGHIQRANTKYCGAPLNYIRPIQDELNRAEKQLIENRNIANGIWFIPDSVELDNAISAEPRQIIKWSGPPNVDPNTWFVQPSGMANWVASEPERIKSTAQDLVSQHEVSNASVPGRVDAAQSIQLLQEADDSVMGDVIHSLNEAIADGFQMAGFLHTEFGDDETLVSVYDKNGIVETEVLLKDMISLDLRVKSQITTGLPQTIAGKWDRVLNLVQYQIIDPQRALELLDLSSENPDLAPYVLDKKNSYRENKEMLAGNIVRARLFEDHDVHREEHEKFCKSEEWRQAVKADPEVEDLFGFHIEEHKKLQAAKDQENAAREAAMQAGLTQNEPAPGGPPAPQPPAPADNGSPAPVAS
jgi:hypothetical protein